MSSYSEFVILRLDKKNIKTVTDNQVKSAYERNAYNLTDDKDIFNKKIEIKDIPTYIKNSRTTYINHFKKEELDMVLNSSFNSMFSVLKDEFNLSPYGGNDTLEISSAEASSMLEAINYLLLEKYDRELEENVLNNRYIHIFGDTYSPYCNYYMQLNKIAGTKDEEGNTFELYPYDREFREDQSILKRVKVILESFLLLHEDGFLDEFSYVLLYIVG